ncbi:MAG: hypothetical protein WEB04_02970 [Dehalococcoidia bacterium]
MKRALIGTFAAVALLGGVFGGVAFAGQGEGHTPVVVCHWVPAAPAGAHSIAGPEDGSYLVIVVDDDAANGNKNLRAHAHHEHDIIAPEGGACGAPDDGPID